MRQHLSFISAAGAIALITLSAFGENWGQWRGPNFNGSTTDRGLPSKFSRTENVVWAVDLPGPSASTASVWKDKVFVSSANKSEQNLQAFCLDRRTGSVLWQRTVGAGYRRDDKSNYSSPSPATDGKHVIFFYGNGELAAFDLAGKELWKRNIQKEFGDFAFNWTFSTSPLLYQNKLYLQVLQRDVPVNGRGRKDGPNESYLLALNPDTGKQLWRQLRPSEAVAESREAFTTPVPYEYKGRKQLIVVGGDCLTGHDLASGKELWRWGTWNPEKISHWRLVPSAIAAEGVTLACAPKGDPIYAIKTDQSGTLDSSAIVWKSERSLTADVPTPAFYDGDFFVLSDVKRNVTRVEPKTGKAKWTCPLPGRSKYEASPSIGDGKLYAMNFAGDAVIVDVAKGEVILNTPMGESGDDMTRSSIALSDGQAFIRTNHKLFCVGHK